MTLDNHNSLPTSLSKLKRGHLILVILDGWGIGGKDYSNPIYAANPQTINFIKTNFAITGLQASGIAVGLPWEEEGNSEIGHLTIGAGRIVYQDLPRINAAIRDGSFFSNPALLEIINYAKENQKTLHLVGLIGEGNVHSSFEHLKAIIRMAEINNLSKFYLHLITDGRDSGPQSAMRLIPELPAEKIGSISGRFFAMDRDNHLERTRLAYLAMTGKGTPQNDIKQVLFRHYQERLTDEFIEPTVIESAERGIKDGDALIFFNFREERTTQLVKMFMENMPHLKIATFTEYGPEFRSIRAAFPRPPVKNSLGQIISEAGLTQLRLAESEKAAHITFFFNAEREEPFPNEYRVIVPSPRVPRYDEHPEMAAAEITDRALSAIEEGIYNFILINYANPDMIGHTGNFNAAVSAVRFLDGQLEKLLRASLQHKFTLIITSDHGNIEKMLDEKTGHLDTRHNTSPVPFYLIDEEFRRPKDQPTAERLEQEIGGSLGDIAPTILELMGLPKPPEMTGQSLLPFVQ